MRSGRVGNVGRFKGREFKGSENEAVDVVFKVKVLLINLSVHCFGRTMAFGERELIEKKSPRGGCTGFHAQYTTERRHTHFESDLVWPLSSAGCQGKIKRIDLKIRFHSTLSYFYLS